MVLMVMTMSIGVSAVAAPNGFFGSPSGNPAPKVISYTMSPAGCGVLVVTPYGDLEKLAVDEQAMLKRAYNTIVGAENIAGLNADLAELAKKERINAEDLAVSDLFDMSVIGCEDHKTHKVIDVVLEADTLDNFVGLLHMKKNGEFELISAEIIKGKDVVVNKDIVVDTEIKADGQYLRFTVDALSPFAIVVNTGKPASNNALLYGVLAVVVIALVLVVILSKKKKEAAETKGA